MPKSVKSVSARIRVSAALAVLLSAISVTFVVVPAQAEGNDGVESLAKCLAQPSAALDVVVLMDKSGSMRTSDKAKERATMVRTSLRLLANVASKDHVYSAKLISWGGRQDSTSPSVDWTTIDGEQDSDVDRIANAATADNANFTDWSFALSEARKAFQGHENVKGESCRLLLWMTDGALDVNNKNRPDGSIVVDASETSALSSICGQSGGPGAIDWFRRSDVLILGALLQNGMPQGNKDASNLFKAVVEGTVTVPMSTAAAYGIEANFSCGTQSGLLGQVQEGSDARSLAWKFIDLVAQAQGLTPLTANGNRFYVDAGLGRVVIYSESSKSPEISGPRGRDVCTSGHCVSSRIGEVLSVTTVTGSDAPGDWTVSVPGGGRASAFAQLAVPGSGSQPPLGLVTNVSGFSGTSIEGSSRAISVQLQQDSKGRPFPITAYDSAQVCFSAGSAAGYSSPECKTVTEPNATFSWNPTLSETAVAVDVHLKSSKGNDYSDRVVHEVTVKSAAGLPTLKCDKFQGGICFLNDLPNRNATFDGRPVATTLHLVGGSKGAVVADWSCKGLSEGDSLGRSYACEIESSLARNSSGNIGAGKTVPVLVRVGFTQAPGESEVACDEDAVEGSISYTVTSADGVRISRQQPIAFCTLADKNLLAVVIAYILLLLIGVGAPLALMLIHARRSAVFTVPDGSLRWAVLPVQIDETGLKSIGPEGAQQFQLPRYDKLNVLEGLRTSRTLGIDSIAFQAIPPRWNPFGITKFIAGDKSQSDSYWITSEANAGDSPQPASAPVTARIAGVWILEFSGETLVPIESDFHEASQSTWATSEIEAHTISAATGPLEAKLRLFIDFYDYSADLSRMQDQLQQSARWTDLWNWLQNQRNQFAREAAVPQTRSPNLETDGDVTNASSLESRSQW